VSASCPWVLSVGALAPTARNALHFTMLLRAGRSGGPILSDLLDEEGRRVTMFAAIPAGEGISRLLALATPPLVEALTSARVRADPETLRALDAPIPFFLALPDVDRPEPDPRVVTDIVPALAKAAGVAVDKDRSLLVRTGHAGFARALEAATLALDERGAPGDGRSGAREQGLASRVAIVGGVDTFFDEPTLRWLGPQGRLSRLGVPTGFVPGEGAGFLVLYRPAPDRKAAPESRRPRALAKLVASLAAAPLEPLLSGREAAPNAATARDSDSGADTQRIELAARLLQKVTGALPRPPKWILTDVNGEPYRTYEWAAVSREALRFEIEHETLVGTTGDCGAATGALLAAYVCGSFSVGAAKDPWAVIALHSDFGQRGAFALEAAQPEAQVAPEDLAGSSRDASPVWAARSVLERMLTVPAGVAREPVCDALDDAWIALGRLERCEAGDPAQLEHLDAAMGHVTRIMAALEGSEGTQAQSASAVHQALSTSRPAILDRIVARQGVFARRASATAREPGAEEGDEAGFLVSRGEPRLYRLRGTAADPFRRFVAAIRTVDDEDENAEAEPGAGEPSSDGQHESADGASPLELRELARDAMETMGRLSWMRRARPSGVWSPELATIDQRLLANLDALVSLGLDGLPAPRARRTGGATLNVLSEVLRYTSESMIDDSRAFARSFVLCSAQGDDPVRAAMLGLRTSSPSTATSHVDALFLASNPRVRAAMEDLCWDSSPWLVRIALEVLRRRREASFGYLLPLLEHPDPVVCRAAVRAMGTLRQRKPAVEALERMATDGCDDDDVQVTLAESLVCLDARLGVEHTRRLLEANGNAPLLRSEPRAALVRLLALAGSGSDLALLLASIRTPEDVEQIGWFGSVLAVEALIRILEGSLDGTVGGGLTIRFSAGRALQRITGFSPAHPDRPALPTDNPNTDARSWRAFWSDRGHAFGMTQKFRHGQPLTAGAILDELEHPGVTNADRESLTLELGILFSGALAPEPNDWISKQSAQIARLREAQRTLPMRKIHLAGEFLGDRLGKRHESESLFEATPSAGARR
jgi:hypothetical protein